MNDDGAQIMISIHAPHAGSDILYHLVLPHIADFNPRSPCGERPAAKDAPTIAPKFQSTLPMRGATACLMAGPGY